MTTAATLQYIWKCIEQLLKYWGDGSNDVNANLNRSIYKWLAFAWLVSAPMCVGSDSAAESLKPVDGSSSSESHSSIASNEIWELSTRHLPQSGCMAILDPSNLRVSRWLPNCGWIESSIEQYLASVQGHEKSSDDSGEGLDLHNIIYVHGNWMPANLTRERGLLIGRYLAQRDHVGFRLTIFSWPSTREKHALADVRENAIVAEVQGLYLASLLQRFPAEKPLGIIGFSYGARAVTGALHALGGGPLCGRELPRGNIPAEIRVSLMAAAIDRNWLLPGGRHQYAANAIDSIVNLYNSNDPVLRRYHLISSTSRGTAAGVAGLLLPRNWNTLPPAEGTSVAAPNHVKLRQFDCRGDLGRSHDERSYYRECSCTIHLMDHVLWNDWNQQNASPFELPDESAY